MNVITITPHGRSGSLLIQSLLDGHQEVATFPGFFSYKWQQNIKNPEAALFSFVKANPSFFNSSVGYLGKVGFAVTTLLGENGNKHIYVEPELFINNFKKLLDLPNNSASLARKDFIIALHRAYAQTLGRDLQKIKFIVIHLHDYTGEHFRILEDFPQMYAIAMVRDPRESWFSWDKICRLRNGVDYESMRFSFRDISLFSYSRFIYKWAQFYKNLGQDHAKIIDLNELHARGENGLREIAQWLGLCFYPSLLKSTFNGELWWGNASDRKPINGLDASRSTYQWQKQMHQSEERYCSSCLHGSISILHYPQGTYDPSLRFEIRHLVRSQVQIRWAHIQEAFKNRNFFLFIRHLLMLPTSVLRESTKGLLLHYRESCLKKMSFNKTSFFNSYVAHPLYQSSPSEEVQL